MGYIFPISLYPPYWKRENTPIKLYPSEKPKHMSYPYLFRHQVDKTFKKKEKTIRNEIRVSAEIYFELTGKGRHINVLK